MSLFSIWFASVIGCLIAKSDTHINSNDLIYFALIGWILFPAYAIQKICETLRNLVADHNE